MKAKHLLLVFFISFFSGFSVLSASTSQALPKDDVQVIDLEGNSVRGVVYIEDELTRVRVCQLKPGETYNIRAVRMQECQPMLELPGTGMIPQQVYNFVAGSSCQMVNVHSDYLKKGCTGTMYLSIQCATCIVKPGSSGGQTRAPIKVQPGIFPTILVEDVFIGGGCFDVANVVHKGDPVSRGLFSEGNTSIGIERGVILSSGPVVNATGPNNTTGAGGATTGEADQDLQLLLGQGSTTPINDASVLHFDFTPTVDQIIFRYVFASEEYCDFANSDFNDVFGFFLSGPGIFGPFTNNAINIATIPGGFGFVPVSINNVNHINNPTYYVGNIPAGDPQLFDPNCQGHPVAGPPSIDDCQFDGYTKVLTAIANVIPCETYHIKLAIGDASDDAFDSAVFLAANSFDAGGEAEVVATVPPLQNTTAYEGCTDGFFRFTRSSGDPSVELVINYTITGTATYGVDYAPIPLSAVIPAGQSSIQIPVDIIDDVLNEGTETIIITLENPCSCLTTTAVMEIVDPVPIQVEIDIDPVCKNDPFTITPVITGGAPPYTYTWSPAGSGPVYNGVTSTGGVYSVTVSEYCGTVDSDTANVVVYTLNATISGTATVCPGSPGYLTVTFTGVGPWSFAYQVSGGTPGFVTGITQNPYQLPVYQPGNYTITAVSDANCTGTGLGIGVVTIPTITLSTEVTNIECYGESTGAIDLSVSGGTSPYTFNWNNNAHTEDLQNLPFGYYVVNVIDNRGCNQIIAALVNQPFDIVPTATVLSGVDCDHPTGGAIDVEVAGGTPGFSFLWNNGSTTQDLSGLTAGAYTVTITDANGCLDTVSVDVPGDSSIPTAEFQVDGAINCVNNTLTLDASASSSGPNYIYEWIASGGGTITGDPNALVTTAEGAGTYEFTVTDTVNICFTSASVTIQPDIDAPLADAGPAQVINCLAGEVVLDGSGSATGPDISIAWSTTNGNFTSPVDILTPTADAPGDYTLVILNTANGCADTSAVSVTADLADPTAAAGPDGAIDCNFPSIQLDGSGSSAGPEFTYLWTTPDGNILDDPTLPNPSVDQSGTYSLLVTNTANGCTDTDEVSVADQTALPNIEIAQPGLVTCAQPEITLDATGSETGAEFVFTWTALNGGTILSGEDSPTPVVTTAGTYELTLLNSLTGCLSVESVDVADDLVSPIADAGLPVTISCSLPDIQLDGSGSSAGPGFTYSWVAAAGGNIVSGANTTTPTVDNSGIYILTVTQTSNGCNAADSVEVLMDVDAPVVMAEASQTLDCTHPDVIINGSGSSAGANFVYDWATADGNIVSGDGTLFLTVNEPGTYTLTVTNTLNDCSNHTEVVVGIDTLTPVAQIETPEMLNCAVTTIQLDGFGSSQGPDILFAWTTPDGNIVGDTDVPNPIVNQPGTYNLLVTDFGNGCTEETAVEVLQDIATPAAEAGPASELNCVITSLNLDGAGSASGPGIAYSWITADGNIVSGGNTLTPVIDAPGTYQITVLNGTNGCEASDEVVITENVSPPQAMVEASGMLTCAVTTLTLNGAVSSGAGPLTYAWSTANGNIVGPAGVPTPMVDQPGDYQLIVTQTENLCQDTTTVTVAQNVALPLAEAGPAFVLDCSTTSLSLDGTGSSSGPDISYSWTTTAGIILSGENTPTPTIGAAGIYELTVLDNSNGCTGADQVEVTLDADVPVSDAGPAQELTCAVTSLTLDGSGSSQGPGITFQWSTADGNILSGDTGLSPEVNAPGTYVLTVLNTGNNCQSSSQVIVAEDVLAPVAEAGATVEITCGEPVVVLNGNGSSQGPEFIYIWTTADGNIVSGPGLLNPQVNQPGTYHLEVTNTANGCVSSDDVIVTADENLPTVVLETPPLLTCAVTSLNLGASGTSTGPDFSYLWTTADGQIISGSTTLSPTIGQPGTYTLHVTNDLNGCSSSASIAVDEDTEPPTAEAGAAGELTCLITTLQLDGTGSSSGADLSYEWTAGPGGEILSGSDTPTPTIGAPGTYTITVLDLANGCSSTDDVIVTENLELPSVAIGPPPALTCITDQVSLDASGSDSGAGFELSWAASGGGNIVSTTDILHPLVDQPGSYTLTILDQNNGCSTSMTVAVTENTDPPGASAGPDLLLHCNQPTVQLQGSSGIGASGQYAWTTADGSILSGGNTPQPVAGASGTYSLTVTDPLNGCISTDEMFVEESTPVEFDFALDPPVCEGFPGSIQFGQVSGGTPPYQYSVDGGASFSSQTIFSGLDPGIYDLTVRDANGCDLFEVAELTEGSDVVLNVEAEVLVDLGDSYQLQVLTDLDPSDIVSITWEPDLFLSCSDCLDPTVTPGYEMNYTVTVTTTEGCEGSANIAFRVNKRADVYVPSIFSPNGDGQNDLFYIFGGRQVVEVRQFLVLDRWGETVFEYEHFQPNDPASGWDGTYRGQELNPGVFAWFAEIELLDGTVKVYEGSVALVR